MFIDNFGHLSFVLCPLSFVPWDGHGIINITVKMINIDDAVPLQLLVSFHFIRAN